MLRLLPLVLLEGAAADSSSPLDIRLVALSSLTSYLQVSHSHMFSIKEPHVIFSIKAPHVMFSIKEPHVMFSIKENDHSHM